MNGIHEVMGSIPISSTNSGNDACLAKQRDERPANAGAVLQQRTRTCEVS